MCKIFTFGYDFGKLFTRSGSKFDVLVGIARGLVEVSLCHFECRGWGSALIQTSGVAPVIITMLVCMPDAMKKAIDETSGVAPTNYLIRLRLKQKACEWFGGKGTNRRGLNVKVPKDEMQKH